MGARFLVGDVFEGLASLPDDSVDLVLTSPPFLALRSYLPEDHPDKAKEIGQEGAPADFLDTLLDVVEACDRVLAPHGSIVFELGDTYSGSGGGGGDYYEGGLRAGQPGFTGSAKASRGELREANAAHWRQKNAWRGNVDADGEPSGGGSSRAGRSLGHSWPLAKSLTGIPTLFAWSLAYGRNLLRPEREIEPWRVRNVRPWVRTNPPVGALGGKWRPGSSYCVIACKGARNYFDEVAMREDAERRGEGLTDWFVDNSPGYSGTHYAVFPPSVPARFVVPLCPERVCRVCGDPSRRIVESDRVRLSDGTVNPPRVPPTRSDAGGSTGIGVRHGMGVRQTTVGWSDCGCCAAEQRSGDLEVTMRGDCWDESHWRPGVVLDPFAGTGTTLVAALGVGLDAIGIDLDSRNLELARERLGMFLEADDLMEG